MRPIVLALSSSLALTACSTSTGSTSLATGNDAPAVQAATPDAIRGVHHIGITVSDIDDTIAYYSQAVPFEVVQRKLIPAGALPADILGKRKGEIEVALIRTPTVFIELTDIDPDEDLAPERRSAIGPGYTHICWQTASSDPGYARFRKLGMEMLSRGDGPVDIGGYGVTYAYGFDRDGIMIEMEQVDKPRRTDSAWVTHIANVTGDKDRMVQFYTGILGYGPHRDLPRTSRKTLDDVVDIDNIAVEGSWFATWNLELEFWHYATPQTPLGYRKGMIDRLGYSGPTFEVTDLAGTVARLQKQGVAFAGDTFELRGWSIRYARDPEGNLLAFQQRTSAPATQSIEQMRWHDPAGFAHR
ncbi:VOC family protein [Parerythrobacter aurantius]|uniref:VOC family protein n=1 Tax=Parerythrobacter aurantius TaxID=3127706 RepID=UPI00324D4215